MDNCIFCKIAKGDIKSEIIYEDDGVLAFLDAQPRAPGHILVIPKKHAETLLDVPKENVGSFFERVQLVLGMVNHALAPDGFTLGINHGKWAGQAVEHLHFHIMPRWKNDGGKSIHSVVDNKPTENLAIIAEKIRSAKN